MNAINAQLQSQGISTITAVLDQTQANTISFQGSATFSISDDHAASGSYVLDGSSAATAQSGVDRLTAPQQATRQIEVGDNTLIPVDQTAQNLFDHRNVDDSPAPENVFVALNSLRVALLNNDSAGIAAAQTSLDTSSQYLNAQDVFYGATENRLTAAVSQINTRKHKPAAADLSDARYEYGAGCGNPDRGRGTGAGRSGRRGQILSKHSF